MPVKFGQTSIRFWFFLSYLITTVLKIAKAGPGFDDWPEHPDKF